MKTNKVLSWEAHLVRRATAGEVVAFELLADLHRPALLQLACRMLRNRDDANDAVQETFLKAFRAVRDFDPSRPIKPWLSRICANCCVDLVRGRRHAIDNIEDYELTLTDPSTDVAASAGGAIQQDQLIDAIERLPDRYRRIIFMRHFRHMEVVEIAKELEKPEGTIKSWLHRARILLKKDLRPAMG